MIGFVYILENEYMPDVYKVGCTERSPHERAAELSKSTGVPAPFYVLCYMEVDNFLAVEQALHAWLCAFRISPSREFFYEGLRHAVAWMWFHPNRLSFCSVPDSEQFGETMLVRNEFEGLFQPAGQDFNLLPNPWEQKNAGEPPTPLDDIDTSAFDAATKAPELRVIEGGATEGRDDDLPWDTTTRVAAAGEKGAEA